MRLAAVAAAVALAGCSSEATRFSDDPNGNPYASGYSAGSSDVTGSVSSQRVESRPLPQVQHGSLPPPPSRYASATGDVTGSVRAQASKSESQASWNWDGGTAVVVRRGETVESLARKHGVPVSAILHANNIANPATIRPGQRLVIPRRSAAASASAPHATATATHTVRPGESLIKIARKYHKSVREIAAANHIETYAKLKAGDQLVIPGVRAAQAAPAPHSAPAPAVAAPKTTPAAAAPKVVAETTSSAHVVTPAAEQPTAKSSVAAANAMPAFRWPVHGRVITAFGPKPNGQQNDGINVSVPEGTPVKAAEDGVVAYAGNELKGYGNLVLLRHANGYVTAYAHASELLVKRGDQVKRGQVIAKSGATGNVTAPQLHFEIRKGALPIDPMPFLGAG